MWDTKFHTHTRQQVKLWCFISSSLTSLSRSHYVQYVPAPGWKSRLGPFHQSRWVMKCLQCIYAIHILGWNRFWKNRYVRFKSEKCIYWCFHCEYVQDCFSSIVGGILGFVLINIYTRTVKYAPYATTSIFVSLHLTGLHRLLNFSSQRRYGSVKMPYVHKY